jgi:glycosyltransferase involved in cell wall biosynthesis
MRKKVWIFNHYAAEMLINEGGRHYWFAKYLKKSGYEPVVFTCNVMHFNGGNYYNSDNLWHEHSAPDGFPFVMIRSTPYQGNGKSRVKNTLVFAKNLAITAKQYAKKYGKPDIIYASSAHPFTVLVGEQLAKQMRIPCICEVRDLWPESIFAYYPEKKNKLLAKVLYAGERWMYSRANMLLFTMPGGKDYIIEKGWHEKRFFRVDEKKIYHINNGVDLDVFNQNVIRNTLHDADLDDNTYCRFIYTGSSCWMQQNY